MNENSSSQKPPGLINKADNVGDFSSVPGDLNFRDVFQEAQTAALLVILIGGIASNGLVFLLFYRKPTLRSFSNRFVLNLSVTHILQCIAVIPYVLVTTIAQEWLFGEIWCQINGAVTICLNMATVLSLVLIAIDRNYAVNSPLHYSMTITKRSTGGLITGTWVIAIISSLPPLFGISRIEYRPEWNSCVVYWFRRHPFSVSYAWFLSTTGFLVPFLKMSWIYCSMFRAARLNSARARHHSLSSNIGEVQSTTTTPAKFYSQLTKKKFQFRRRSSSSSSSSIFGEEWKAVRTGLLVMLSFILCWFPFFAVISTEPLLEEEQSLPGYMPSLVSLFSFSACVINPYLYVFRNKTTRKHVKRLFRCAKTDRQNSFLEYQRSRNLRYVASSVVVSDGLSKDIQSTVGDMHTLYQDADGKWKMLLHSPDSRARAEVADDSISNTSEDGLDSLSRDSCPSLRRLPRMSLDYSVGRAALYRRTSLDSNVMSIYLRDPDFDSTSYHSNDPLFAQRNRTRNHLGSSESDSTENGRLSFDSGSSNEDSLSWYSLLNHRKDSKGSIATLLTNDTLIHHHNLHYPPHQHFHTGNLRKAPSTAMEEKELNCATGGLPRFNSSRRSSIAVSRLYNNRYDSNETPLNSRINSVESQDCATGTPRAPQRLRPRLIRQQSAVISNYHPFYSEMNKTGLRRGSIDANTMLEDPTRFRSFYYFVDETSDNRCVRFLHQ